MSGNQVAVDAIQQTINFWKTAYAKHIAVLLIIVAAVPGCREEALLPNSIDAAVLNKGCYSLRVQNDAPFTTDLAIAVNSELVATNDSCFPIDNVFAINGKLRVVFIKADRLKLETLLQACSGREAGILHEQPLQRLIFVALDTKACAKTAKGQLSALAGLRPTRVYALKANDNSLFIPNAVQSPRSSLDAFGIPESFPSVLGFRYDHDFTPLLYCLQGNELPVRAPRRSVDRCLAHLARI